MAATKAVKEARERLAEAHAELRKHDEAIAAREAAMATFRAKLARWAKKWGKRPVIKQEPQDEFVVSTDGLANFRVDSIYGLPKPLPKSLAKLMPLLAETKVSFGGQGVALSIKGAVQRVRFVSPATIKELDRLDKAATRAEQRAYDARMAWKAAKKAAFQASTEKPTADEIVQAVAERALVSYDAPNGYSGMDTYSRQRVIDYVIPDAEKHLAHALSKSKDPCPCNRCIQQRQQVEWQRQREAAEKARAEAEKAEAKRIRNAPKVRFTCPACDIDSITVIETGTDEATGKPFEWIGCEVEDCGWQGRRSVVKTTRVPKTETVQPIFPEDEQDQDKAA